MINYFLTSELQLEVKNSTGLAAQIVDQLASNGIVVEAFSAHSLGTAAFVFLVTDDNIGAASMLKQMSDVIQVTENPVVFIEKTNWSMVGYQKISHALSNNAVEINHFYSTTTNNKPYFVINTSDNQLTAHLIEDAA